jgi:hypothetical protein
MLILTSILLSFLLSLNIKSYMKNYVWKYKIYWSQKQTKNKLHGLSLQANYTDRETAACRRSYCQLLRIEESWIYWSHNIIFPASTTMNFRYVSWGKGMCVFALPWLMLCLYICIFTLVIFDYILYWNCLVMFELIMLLLE